MTSAVAARPRTFLTVFTLLLSLTILFSSALPAYAAAFNPGCAGTTGDAAALESAVVTSRTNSQADTINLVGGCTYTVSSLHFLSDGGNAVTVNGNGASVNGGGNTNFLINNDSGTNTTINDLIITNGRTGVLNTGSLTLNNVTITNNSSTNVGGGIINGVDGVFTGTITVNNSTVTNNAATSSGGGIYNAVSSTVNLNRSTVRDNDAPNGGGIHTKGTVMAINSTISGNEATIGGGGIFNQDGTVNLNNSTVSSNISPGGPNLGSNLRSSGASSAYFLYNSIVANPVNASNCSTSAGTFEAFFNVLSDGSCNVTTGSGNINQNPNLGALTGSPAYFPLNPGSPAINAGNNALIPGGTTTDQPGNARIRGTFVDMGSYEAEIPIISISPSTANASEGGISGLTVSRVGNTSAAQPVSFSVGGSASAADYSLSVDGSTVTNSLTIPAGQGTVNLVVTAINDTHAEADETVAITLSDTNHYDLGSPSASTVTILANDLLVINGNDSGEGSLRQAAINANNFNTNDSISFSGVTTVTLTSGELGLANNGTLTINGNGVTVSSNGASRVFNVFGGATVTLNRLTVTGGNGTLGGGINNDGTLTIVGSTIRNNSATGGGGVASNAGATLTLTNSTVTGNSTGLAGGAILNNGTLTLNNTTIAGNSTGFGNAVVANGTVTINNSIIADPSAGANCGGVGSIDVNFSVIEGGGCGITNNVDGNKTGDPGLGALIGSPAYFPVTDSSIAVNAGSNALIPGGITTDQPGNTRIRGSVVDMGSFELQCVSFPYTVPASNIGLLNLAIECANSVSSNDVISLTTSLYTLNGQLSLANNGTLTINGNSATVSGNDASRVFDVASGATVTLNEMTVRDGSAALGGGINNNGTLTLSRVTVRDNAASGLNGGGIQINGGSVTLINSTVTGNNAPSNGGGIFNNGTLSLINTTIAGNSAGGNGGGVSNNLGTATINNSIIADNTGNGNCFHANPPSISNSVIEGGGCGVTDGVNGNKTSDPALGALTGAPAYFPIIQTSVAFNAGSNAFLPGGVTTDQPGNTRIRGGVVDMGSFEVQCLTFPFTVPAADTPLLNLAVECANSSGSNEVINLTASTYALTGTLTLANNGTLTINGNAATISGNGSSRVFEVATGAIVTLNHLTISGGAIALPTATVGGAGILNNGTLTVNRSTFTGNLSNALVGGGGIQNNATLTMMNSTVYANVATAVGGGLFNAGTAAINNSTFAFNAGAGIVSSGTLTLNNSILANNTGGDCTGTATVNFTLVGSGGCGVVNGVGGNKIGDPSLGNATGSPAYFPLLARSIAINAGSNALVPGGVTTDQPGNTRIQNTTVDMGAYESTAASLTLTLTLQGRPAGASPTKVVTVHIQVRQQGSTTPIFSQDFVSDTNGLITIPDLTALGYDIWIKGTHTLARVQSVTLTGGSNSATTQALREGDTNDNNQIVLDDFSLLAAAFGTATGNPNFNAQADFNGDGQVQLIDFSLLASNFNQGGAP